MTYRIHIHTYRMFSYINLPHDNEIEIIAYWTEILIKVIIP